jgi:hypothetical protein
MAVFRHRIVSRRQSAGKRKAKLEVHFTCRRDNPKATVETQTRLTAADKKKIPGGCPWSISMP